jgi:hypothetical protein
MVPSRQRFGFPASRPDVTLSAGGAIAPESYGNSPPATIDPLVAQPRRRTVLQARPSPCIGVVLLLLADLTSCAICEHDFKQGFLRGNTGLETRPMLASCSAGVDAGFCTVCDGPAGQSRPSPFGFVSNDFFPIILPIKFYVSS